MVCSFAEDAEKTFTEMICPYRMPEPMGAGSRILAAYCYTKRARSCSGFVGVVATVVVAATRRPRILRLRRSAGTPPPPHEAAVRRGWGTGGSRRVRVSG